MERIALAPQEAANAVPPAPRAQTVTVARIVIAARTARRIGSRSGANSESCPTVRLVDMSRYITNK